MTEAGCEEASALLRRAAELDPGLGLAKAQLAACLTRRIERGWARPGDHDEAVRLARDVVEDSDADPIALVCAVYAYGLVAQDTASAFDIAQRALKLNTSSALAQATVGLTYAWAGDPVASAAHFTRAIELNPCDPEIAFWTAGLARAELMAGRPEGAVPLAEQAIRQMSKCVAAHRVLIAALSRLGRRGDASSAVDRLRATVPELVSFSAKTARHMYRDQCFAEMLIRAWRDAGLPEKE